jgi:hypothetical protein
LADSALATLLIEERGERGMSSSRSPTEPLFAAAALEAKRQDILERLRAERNDVRLIPPWLIPPPGTVHRWWHFSPPDFPRSEPTPVVGIQAQHLLCCALTRRMELLMSADALTPFELERFHAAPIPDVTDWWLAEAWPIPTSYPRVYHCSSEEP